MTRRDARRVETATLADTNTDANTDADAERRPSPSVSRGAVAEMLRMVDGRVDGSDRVTFPGSGSTPMSHGDALLRKGVGGA